MKKVAYILSLVSICLLLVACNSGTNDSNESADDEAGMQTEGLHNFAAINEESLVEDDSFENAVESGEETGDQLTTERMIIHEAHLHIQVKNLEKMQANMETMVNKYKGYIVESNIQRENENYLNGYIVVRIPEKHFQSFLSDAEATATEVLERNVTGQDVTEQYVDLESRLTSKQAVEKRLLEFMDDAKKTEDLLKISSDLATVQEEIEVIVGKMKYLENQTSYSTITISMVEDRVIIPEIENKNLDTWEKTKKQLAQSTNFLLATGSAIVVFFIGNIPIFLILSVIGLGAYFMIKRRRNKNSS